MEKKPITCPKHGAPRYRASCEECNAAYMRGYLRRRSRERPGEAIWERARRRANRYKIDFDLPKDGIVIPDRCPALGIPLATAGQRSATSPSLDRIEPNLGYVRGNVRVISDRANRIKGDRGLEELRERAANDNNPHAPDYQKVAAYLDRELLLKQVRCRAASAPSERVAAEWTKVGDFLDRAFARGPVA